jgi:acyl-CoA thioester hydrolase
LGRIKIIIQGNPLYTFAYQVSARDINYGGHMGNDAFVSLLQEARIQWLRTLGYSSEMQIEGLGWIQADLQILYLGECFMGDHLQVQLFHGEVSKKHIELQYKIYKFEKVVVEASTNLLFFDYVQKKIVNMPSEFDRILREI